PQGHARPATPRWNHLRREALGRWLRNSTHFRFIATHKKTPSKLGVFFVARGCLHHAAHATHTAHATHIRHCRSLVVSALSNHGFGGNHQTADGGRSLQRGTGHLGRVENTHLDHVAIGVGRSVEAEVAFALLDLVDHYARLAASVGDDLAQRSLDGATQQSDTDVLVFVVALELGDGLQSAYQSNTTARYHAFFNGCTSGVQGVFDAGLLLFHLDFGTSTDRKSTRLNSSHVKISYAVFCLKKKNNKCVKA